MRITTDHPDVRSVPVPMSVPEPDSELVAGEWIVAQSIVPPATSEDADPGAPGVRVLEVVWLD